MTSWLKNENIEIFWANNEAESYYLTAMLKNAYINKLPKIKKWYNNPAHRTIKMKHTFGNPDEYIDFPFKCKIKIINLRLKIMWQYQNTEIHFERIIFQTKQKNCDWSNYAIEICDKTP